MSQRRQGMSQRRQGMSQRRQGDIRRSKFLSYVLRHAPHRIGIELDSAGWVDVEILVEACQRAHKDIRREDLERIVAESDKQRFALSADGQRIRANQGHSVEVDLGLTPQDPPATLYHGTARRWLAQIQREGLKRGRRHHVHLSADADAALAVGRRYGEAVLLSIEAAAMSREGSVFWCTENGVWLVTAVPPRFLRELPPVA